MSGERLNTVYPVNTHDRLLTLVALGLLLGATVGPGVYCHRSSVAQVEACFDRCGGSAYSPSGGCVRDRCFCIQEAPNPTENP